MRKAAIEIEEISEDVIILAKEQVGAAIAAQQKILCFGQPASAIDIKPNDPTATMAVIATCTECGVPIYSSELKETILYLAPEMIDICCLACFLQQTKKAGPGTTVTAIIKPGSDSQF